LNWVKFSSKKDEIMIVTNGGKSIHFNEDDVRQMGRPATGVRGIKLKKDDFVVEMDVVKAADETSELIVVMENGLGKMTKVKDFRLQTRGGSGVKAANLTKKTGSIIGAKVISSDFKGDLILTAKSGQSIRMSLDDVPSRGRSTQGVILMRLPSGDSVSSVSSVATEILSEGQPDEGIEPEKLVE
jgi:DNA gyrase subunit A